MTQEKRKQAEDIFMDLKKSKLPYNACKFILGRLAGWGRPIQVGKPNHIFLLARLFFILLTPTVQYNIMSMVNQCY